MKYGIVFSIAVLAALVTACGGGGSSNASSASDPAATTYAFTTPTVDSPHLSAQTIIDNFNNTINETISDQVTAVNPDGSYVVHKEDPTHNSIEVEGRNYSIETETINYNSAGQEVSYSYAATDGSQKTCVFSPHGAGPTYPIVIGDTWSSSWTITCANNSPIAYTQTGSVVDVESVTVPTGTFTALKVQSTIVWTDANGTTHTESLSTWRDVNTGHSVEERISISYSGTTPANGYPVTITIMPASQT